MTGDGLEQVRVRSQTPQKQGSNLVLVCFRAEPFKASASLKKQKPQTPESSPFLLSETVAGFNLPRESAEGLSLTATSL